jgi:hypothetical protein
MNLSARIPGRACASALAVIAFGLTVLLALAAPVRGALRLESEVAICVPPGDEAVRLAAADVARDLGDVLGRPARVVEAGADAAIRVRFSPDRARPESYVLVVTDAGVTIDAADTLGAVYGLYRFSHALAGVDPYAFWKGVRPARLEALALQPQTLTSPAASFRYRGWFVNDEDLLTEWREPSGVRRIDYPFYGQVVSAETADRVFETALRAGANLVIPASFVDVMNPPEAALVRRAAGRGLYVTQHHVEPLGVSHFGFENFWKARGEAVRFSYATDPDRVRQSWAAYAARWRELAGDRVVWQLGLRGRGDQPAWAADKGMTEAGAGAFISRALADQWAIVRKADPRPQPPATTTLWMEGSALMSRGALEIPDGVAVVFADEGSTQTMQADFRDTPRQAGRGYGVYYHVAYWSRGPHLVQGIRPERLRAVFDEIIAKGDTHYAIINVSNVREHLLGIEAAMRMMRGERDWTPEGLLADFAGPQLAPLYRRFLDAILPLDGGARLLQDGVAWGALRDAVADFEAGRKPRMGGLMAETLRTGGRGDALGRAVGELDAVIADFDRADVPTGERPFYAANLKVQAAILRGMYETLRQLALASADPARLAHAEAALAGLLDARREAEAGQWANWYRGDKKENLPALLARLKRVRERSVESGT